MAKTFATFAVVAAAFLIGVPQVYADYTDVADSYGTVASVEPLSSALSASEIPEGVYTDCDSRTSSTYFKLYDLSIVVEDGVITMKASASASYTAIAMGEAEDVAAACSADELGADAVDISHGALFSMQIPALNASFEIATYSKSREAWYTRTVCIDAVEGSQVQKAILKAKADAETGGDSEDEDEDKDKDKDSDSDTEDSGKEDSSEKSGSDEKSKKSESKESAKSENASKGTSTSTGTSKSASSGTAAGKSSQTNKNTTSKADEKTTAKKAAPTDPNYRKFFSGQVRKVNFTGSGIGDNAAEVKSNNAADQYIDSNALAVKLVALLSILLLAVGFALRVVLFRAQSTKR